MGGAMWHVWGRGKVHTGFWWGNLRQGAQLEEPAMDGRIILKWTLMKSFGKDGTGLICIRIGTSGKKRIPAPQNAGNLNGSATVSFPRISLLYGNSY